MFLAHRTNNQLGLTVAVIALTLCFAASPGKAAPQQQAPPEVKTPSLPPTTVTADPLTGAQQLWEGVQVRYKAGVATVEELDQAKAAFLIAVATAKVRQARTAWEQQKSRVAAGLDPVASVAESELAVTQSEVALQQAQTDQWKQVIARRKTRTGGLLFRTTPDIAPQKLKEAQTQLAAVKARYQAQRIAVLKTRLAIQQELARAGVTSQSEVDKAQVAYEAAIAASLQ